MLPLKEQKENRGTNSPQQIWTTHFDFGPNFPSLMTKYGVNGEDHK